MLRVAVDCSSAVIEEELANHHRLCAQRPSCGSDTAISAIPYRASPRGDRGRRLHSSDLDSGAAQLAPYLCLADFIEDLPFTLGK